MTLISYAQNFEDIRLWRAFSDVSAGRYLDIGAQDPVQDSVSRLFYERGWRGISVEPTPAYAEALRAARPDVERIQAHDSARAAVAANAVNELAMMRAELEPNETSALVPVQVIGMLESRLAEETNVNALTAAKLTATALRRQLNDAQEETKQESELLIDTCEQVGASDARSNLIAAERARGRGTNTRQSDLVVEATELLSYPSNSLAALPKFAPHVIWQFGGKGHQADALNSIGLASRWQHPAITHTDTDLSVADNTSVACKTCWPRGW